MLLSIWYSSADAGNCIHDLRKSQLKTREYVEGHLSIHFYPVLSTRNHVPILPPSAHIDRRRSSIVHQYSDPYSSFSDKASNFWRSTLPLPNDLQLAYSPSSLFSRPFNSQRSLIVPSRSALVMKVNIAPLQDALKSATSEASVGFLTPSSPS